MPSSKTIHSQQRLRYQRFLFISILRQNPRALTPHHGVIPKALRPELGRGAAQCSSVPAKSRTPGSASQLICRAARPAQPIASFSGTLFEPSGGRNFKAALGELFWSRLAAKGFRQCPGTLFQPPGLWNLWAILGINF